MTLFQLSEHIYNKSQGRISIQEAKDFLSEVYKDGRITGYQNGYRQCSLDRRNLKKLSKSINMDMINEFHEECIGLDIFDLRTLSKHPDLVQKYKDLFSSDMLF